jgi:pilus assembly protein CpaE
LSDRIRVVIVDDIPETREHLEKLISFEPDIEVVGSAASGEEALVLAGRLRPDVLLMDINMPGMDGIAATERMAAAVPTAAIIMMSVQGETDYMRRSMLAGARDFLVKPFSSEALSAAIRQVHARERDRLGRMTMLPVSGDPGDQQPGRVVSVFSPKGGVGRTTLAVNLAVALAGEQRKSLVLVDGSFQFGDVSVLLNLNPRNKSIVDAIAEGADTDNDNIDSALINHSTGIRVLLAPPSPEMAELINGDQARRILGHLRSTHEIVVVDLWSHIDEVSLAALDMSDTILCVLTLEITNIKDTRLFLEVAEQLGYAERIRLVLNRADAAFGIRVGDVESAIGRRIDHQVVSDGRTVVYALNRGVPFVWSNSQAPVSEDILKIGRSIVAGEPAAGPTESGKQPARRALLGRKG